MFCVGLPPAGDLAQEAKVADLNKEHRWRHWEGHWGERRQKGGREGGREHGAGAGGRRGRSRGKGVRGKEGKGGSPGNTCSHNRDSQSGMITRIPISVN